ncbi:1,4-alpha-glucan branching enzyme GlgB [Clostridia bacterium]|nr:1,4-alpha-glucan branching enzyme GlgB [Clostridia bacterium]
MPKAKKAQAAQVTDTPAEVEIEKTPEQKSLDLHLYLFHEGCDSRAYKFLGANLERGGTRFRVWAPNARDVSVVGDFNEWDAAANPMNKISVGVWELFVKGVKEFAAYKFAVTDSRGRTRQKSDPYAFHAETRPKTASKVYRLSGYDWGDGDWISSRAESAPRPMNIYEVHLGSWRRGENDTFLTYADAAELLIPYVKEMGYTHIEFMPLTEHPLDDSWGYQVTGYFAATSRFGTPKDLMGLIDKCHRAGIGVLLDWVPAHFPKDGHGLVEFDGNYCYEYGDPLKMEHTDWGTRIFDFGRNEVRSFLMSSALFWIEHFHIDGLRVDAVASMLYLDYGRKQGEWRPNIHGGHENLEAVDFLRKLNEAVYAQFPGTMMIAEESTSWPMVTQPTYMGGLGFTYKWNMGWMNDTLRYMQLDPIYRQYQHNCLTFSMMYAFSEQYVLPLSHDEVVHLKKSIIDKMPGFYDDKFAGVRAYFGYMAAHPGRKLLFMGGEFGQFGEWNFKHSLDWHLLEYDRHKQLKHYVATLNRFYLDNPALWENDLDWEGFNWLCCDDYRGNTLAMRRVSLAGTEVVAAFNFSPVNRLGYRIGLPEAGAYREVLNSDAHEFGGWGNVNNYDIHTEDLPWQGQAQSINITLPPYGAVFLKKA